jgi:hypothetical protein
MPPADDPSYSAYCRIQEDHRHVVAPQASCSWLLRTTKPADPTARDKVKNTFFAPVICKFARHEIHWRIEYSRQ